MIARVLTSGAGAYHGFKRIVAYIVREGAAREIWTSPNISSAAAAAAEMEAVADQYRRGFRADPQFHYILSWRECGAIPKVQIHECVLGSVEALGFAQQQWIAAVHYDTDHTHVHVAINRVHPETIRITRAFRSYRQLSAYCARQNSRYGWQDERRADVALENITLKSVRGRGLAAEIWLGQRSLQRWIGENAVRALDADWNTLTWQRAHEILAQYGLCYEVVEKRDGRGGVVIDRTGKSPYAVRGSLVSRDLGLPAMERRLGHYIQPSKNLAINWRGYGYLRDRLLVRTAEVELPEIAPLYLRWIRERNAAKRNRRRADRSFLTRRARRARKIDLQTARRVLDRYPDRQRAAILHAALDMILGEERATAKAERQAARAALPLQERPHAVFRAWLKEHDRAGDEAATRALHLIRVGNSARLSGPSELALLVAERVSPMALDERDAVESDETRTGRDASDVARMLAGASSSVHLSLSRRLEVARSHEGLEASSNVIGGDTADKVKDREGVTPASIVCEDAIPEERLGATVTATPEALLHARAEVKRDSTAIATTAEGDEIGLSDEVMARWARDDEESHRVAREQRRPSEEHDNDWELSR